MSSLFLFCFVFIVEREMRLNWYTQIQLTQLHCHQVLGHFLQLHLAYLILFSVNWCEFAVCNLLYQVIQHSGLRTYMHTYIHSDEKIVHLRKPLSFLHCVTKMFFYLSRSLYFSAPTAWGHVVSYSAFSSPQRPSTLFSATVWWLFTTEAFSLH